MTEIGAGMAKGTIVNIPFSGAVMGNPEYLLAWRLLVEPLLNEFQPDIIMVSVFLFRFRQIRIN